MKPRNKPRDRVERAVAITLADDMLKQGCTDSTIRTVTTLAPDDIKRRRAVVLGEFQDRGTDE